MSYTPPNGGSANFFLFRFVPPNGGSADFLLYANPLGELLIGMGVRKKLGQEGQPDPLGVFGIYQMRMTKRGKMPIKMKFYRPTNPQTEPQEANRAKFADAMTAWGALTTEEKSAYNVRAKKRQMFGWGLFIREYYQAN